MKLLVVNVNTTSQMTRRYRGLGTVRWPHRHRDHRPDPHLGAESVEGNFESYLAAVAVMNAVATYPGPSMRLSRPASVSTAREGLQELPMSPSLTSPRPPDTSRL